MQDDEKDSGVFFVNTVKKGMNQNFYHMTDFPFSQLKKERHVIN